jgi:5-methyltetrahydropteroyltriglutamate--homocysteine methyltransferase
VNRSVDRFLTTHAGSLPRPQRLLDVNLAKERHEPFDESSYARDLKLAVADIVQRQVDVGLDIVDDGEFGKSSFVTYVNERLSGIEPGKDGVRTNPWRNSREYLAFPEFYEWAAQLQGSSGSTGRVHMLCTGPIAYKGQVQLMRDLENLKSALKGTAVQGAFIPAISPANVEGWQKNEFYKNDEEYLFAIADAMHEEYKTIVEAGFLVQIDDPRLATYYVLNPGLSLDQCRAWANVRVDALNHALRGIPPEKVRYHTCYSINMGPRVHDMNLRDIVDVMLRINAGAYSFEAANPRHEHEWTVWEDIRLPEGKAIIPGVITHTSNLVEHPELVAQRITRFAKLVGRENVIAGSDCGFATFSTSLEVHPSVVWAKFQALVEGALLASKQFWSCSR